MRTVVEVARTDVGTLRPDDTVARALAEMDRTGSDQLPVCRAEDLEGVVTRGALDEVDDPAGAGVAPYVESVTALDATTALDEALAALDRSGLAWLPVVDAGRLVGAVGAFELEPALRSDADAESPGAAEEPALAEPINYATGAPAVAAPRPVDDRGSSGRARAVALVFLGAVLVLAVLLVIAITVL